MLDARKAALEEAASVLRAVSTNGGGDDSIEAAENGDTNTSSPSKNTEREHVEVRPRWPGFNGLDCEGFCCHRCYKNASGHLPLVIEILPPPNK